MRDILNLSGCHNKTRGWAACKQRKVTDPSLEAGSVRSGASVGGRTL